MKATTMIVTVPQSETEAQALMKHIRDLGGTIAFEGSYETQEPATESKTISAHYDNDDDLGLLLTDANGTWLRELSENEVSQICEEGSVTKIMLTHPRAEKYGLPVSASCVPDLWLALAGNLGFRPSENLELEPEDSGDDGVGFNLLEIEIPATLWAAMKATSERVNTVIEDILAGAPNAVEEAMREHSRKSDEELASELNGALALFNANGGRGVEIAEKIDSLRLIVDMRSVLKTA